jgi:hypothetical protein
MISLTGIGFTALTAALAPCEVRCPCAVPPAPWNTAAYLVPRARNEAAIVVTGRIVRADTLVRDTVFAARNYVRTRPKTIRYTFVVSGSWKGTPPDTVWVTDDGVHTSCGAYVEVNVDYLMYLRRNRGAAGPQEYSIDSCTRRLRLAQAGEDLDLLGAPEPRP